MFLGHTARFVLMVERAYAGILHYVRSGLRGSNDGFVKWFSFKELERISGNAVVGEATTFS